ncbi:MAG TPA: mechanosensitive channel MscK, partial [Pseudomonadales bacterium]|nr:mechanosensitive channel MscK [Pseudomonadales bacterium]
MLTFLRLVLLSLFITLTPVPPALAQDVPSVAQVQRSLDTLSQRNLSDADAQAAKLVLQQTLHLLEKRDEYQQKLVELKQTVQDAPKQINSAQQELSKLKASEPMDIAKRYSNWRVAQLTQMQTERNTQLLLWQKSLAEANSLALNAQTRPEKAQAEISQNQARIQEISNKLKSDKDNGKSLSQEMRQQLASEQVMLEVYNELLRQELQSNSLLLDLGNSQRDVLVFKIGRIEQENLALQTLINDKRRAESEQTVAELAKDSAQTGSDSLLNEQNEENLNLSNNLLKITDRLNEVTRLNLQSRLQLDNLSQSSQALQEQINVLKGSVLLSKILLQQKQSLPKIEMYSQLADEIADIRLSQFELNQKREALSNPEQFANDLMTQKDASPDIKSSLLDILRLRGELQDRLNRDLNALLNECINLQLNQDQLRTMSDSLRQTLDEQLFWIPSHRPLDAGWFKQMPSGVLNQFAAMPWANTLQQFGNGMLANLWLFIPLLLLIATLLYKRNYLKEKLDALDKDINHLGTDTQLHTPLALLLNVLLALPVSLFLLLGGIALRLHAEGQNTYLGKALIEMAIAWLVLYTSYRLLKPG